MSQIHPSHSHHGSKTRRAGTTLVEMAIVLPVFFAVFLGVVEISREFAAFSATEVAALRAARTLTLPSGTPSKAIAAAEQTLLGMGYDRQNFSVSIRPPRIDPETAKVTVSVALTTQPFGKTVGNSITRSREEASHRTRDE